MSQKGSIKMKTGHSARRGHKASHNTTSQRYWEAPGVEIKESCVPCKLRALLPLAQQWSMLGDDSLEEALRKCEPETVARTLRTAMPLKDTIAEFAFDSAGAAAIPVPDEVVLFQIFYWALCRLESAMP